MSICKDCGVPLLTDAEANSGRCYRCIQNAMDKMTSGATITPPPAEEAAKALGMTFTGTPGPTGVINWTGPDPKTWEVKPCVNCGKMMKAEPGIMLCAVCAKALFLHSPSKEPEPAATTTSSGSTAAPRSQRFTSDFSSGLLERDGWGFVNIPAAVFIMLLRAVGGYLEISDLDLIQEPNVHLKVYRVESPPRHVIELEEKE